MRKKRQKYDIDMSHVKGEFAEKISFIRDRILEAVPKGAIDKIYLFGSYARGDNTEDSDIDFCILINNWYKKQYNDLHFKIDDAFIEHNILPSDRLIYMKDYFMKKDSCRKIRESIFEEGKLMYG